MHTFSTVPSSWTNFGFQKAKSGATLSVEGTSTFNILYFPMHDLITNFLTEHEFNKKDIKVYLDIYKYDQSFASSIALRTNIDRTTVYAVLKRLLKRGVIVQTKMKGAKAYLAVSPKIFMDKLDREVEILQSQKKAAALFAEEMQKIRRRSFVKPRTKIYEGTEAIIALYKQSLENPGEQKSFLTLKSIPEGLKHFLRRDFIKLKLKKGVNSKVLVANSPNAIRYQSLDGTSNRQTKIITKHPFELHSEIILFNKSEIAIIDFHEQIYGIIIESTTLYASIEALFDYIWVNES